MKRGLARPGSRMAAGAATALALRAFFGFADHATFAAPTVQRAVLEILEPSRRLACRNARLGGGRQIGGDLDVQPRVLRQTEQKLDVVGLAPGHQLLSREAGIGAKNDANFRPAGADSCDNPRNLIGRARARVDVGLAQFGDQELVAAENVQRQVTIAVVVAVEEAPLLLAVQ